jgi:hypothetical protein
MANAMEHSGFLKMKNIHTLITITIRPSAINAARILFTELKGFKMIS